MRFTRWQRGSPQEPSLSGGTLTAALPIPYSLPPTRYNPAEDTPWAVNTPWPGLDSFGCTIANPHGSLYGVLEEADWANA